MQHFKNIDYTCVIFYVPGTSLFVHWYLILIIFFVYKLHYCYHRQLCHSLVRSVKYSAQCSSIPLFKKPYFVKYSSSRLF